MHLAWEWTDKLAVAESKYPLKSLSLSRLKVSSYGETGSQEQSITTLAEAAKIFIRIPANPPS